MLWRLREFPQVSREMLWRLREFPQVPRHLPRRLRRLRWVPRHLLWRLREFRRDLAALHGRVAGGVRLSGGRVRPGGLRITHATCRAYAGGIVFAGALCTDGNRVASNTYDPADAAIELPAALTIQRPWQSSCQRHLRSSGPGNRVASGTYDPADAAIELPTTLTIQRPWQSSCQLTYDPAALAIELPANKKMEIPYVELTLIRLLYAGKSMRL